MPSRDSGGGEPTLPPPRAPFTVTTAAIYVARDPSYLRRAVRERKIGFYKLGGRIRFSQADLDEHLEAGHVPVNGRIAAPGYVRPALAVRWGQVGLAVWILFGTNVAHQPQHVQSLRP